MLSSMAWSCKTPMCSSRDPTATRSGTAIEVMKKDEETAALQSNIAESGEIFYALPLYLTDYG